MKSSSAKAKGRRLQQKVAADLCAAFNLSTDDVQSCPGGSHGEDVRLSEAARDIVPWSIECKNQERLNVWSAFDQAESNANGHVPVVVAKRNHRDALCTMRWADALALLVQSKKRKSCTDHSHEMGKEDITVSSMTSGIGSPLRSTPPAPSAPPGVSNYLRRLADHLDECDSAI